MKYIVIKETWLMNGEAPRIEITPNDKPIPAPKFIKEYKEYN